MARCPSFSMTKEIFAAFGCSRVSSLTAARQVDIVNAFGVPLPTVKRYLKLLRDQGPKAFFAESGARSGSVLKGERLQSVQSLLQEGSSVPEGAQATGIAET